MTPTLLQRSPGDLPAISRRSPDGKVFKSANKCGPCLRIHAVTPPGPEPDMDLDLDLNLDLDLDLLRNRFHTHKQTNHHNFAPDTLMTVHPCGNSRTIFGRASELDACPLSQNCLAGAAAALSQFVFTHLFPPLAKPNRFSESRNASILAQAVFRSATSSFTSNNARAGPKCNTTALSTNSHTLIAPCQVRRNHLKDQGRATNLTHRAVHLEPGSQFSE